MCYGKSFLLKNTKQNVNNVTQCGKSWIFVEMCYENDRAYDRYDRDAIVTTQYKHSLLKNQNYIFVQLML